MIYNNAEILAALASPVREVSFTAWLYDGDNQVDVYTKNDRLISLTIEKVGNDSKFFGYGVCHKLNIKLIDKDR